MSQESTTPKPEEKTLGTTYEGSEEAEEDGTEQAKADEEEIKLTDTVTAGAADLMTLASSQLTQVLESRVLQGSKQALQSPYEAISDVTSGSPRLDNLEKARDKALAGVTDNTAQEAHASFLEAMFGVDLSGLDDGKRRDSATTLLTHLFYSASGHTLPETLASPAAADVAAMVKEFAAFDDDDYWLTLADAYDGQPVSGLELEQHLVIMGLTVEMKPLSAQFMWHNSATIALHVDELIQASGSSPLRGSSRTGAPVDIAAMYRRASTLLAGGAQLPRAVAAELVRMAIAELRVGIQPERAALRTPTRKRLQPFLLPEPLPDNATSADTAAAKARNLVRTAAAELTAAAPYTGPTGSDILTQTFRATTRAGRGYLTEIFNHQVADVRNAVLRSPGGSKTAATLDALVAKSGVAGAIDAWNAVYRSSERDPAKLQPLLADLTQRAKSLNADLAAAFPMSSGSGEIAAGVKDSVSVLATEIAYEATELITGRATAGPPRLVGVTAVVETASVQGRTRLAATMARDGKAGLGDFVTKSLKAYATAGWCADLKAAADAWSVPDTRDFPSIAKATSAYVDAVTLVAAKVAKLTATAPDEAFLAQNAIDALSFAVLDRIQSLSTIDPQTAKLNLLPQVSSRVAELLTTFDKPTNLASYWGKGKNMIKGKLPSLNLDLQSKLATWQKAINASNPDRAAIAAATYPVIEAIVDYRARIENGKNSAADKVLLLRLLDTLVSSMKTRLAQL